MSEADNVTAATAAAVADRALETVATTKRKRGANMTCIEDLFLAKAFIKASEDSEVGKNMKGAKFKQKIWDNYCLIVADNNNRMRSNYDSRTAASCFTRFRMISKLVMKYLGIEETTDRPSGLNADDVFDNLCCEAFCNRYPEDSKWIDHVSMVKDFLYNKPKWIAWQKNENSDEPKEKKPRPEGTKKAKQKAADLKMAHDILSTEEKKKNDQEQRQQDTGLLLKQVGDSMGKVGASLDVVVSAVASSVQEQTDLRLAQMMSPTSQSDWAKSKMKYKKLELDVKTLELEKRKLELQKITSQLKSDDQEVEVVGIRPPSPALATPSYPNPKDTTAPAGGSDNSDTSSPMIGGRMLN